MNDFDNTCESMVDHKKQKKLPIDFVSLSFSEKSNFSLEPSQVLFT